MSIRPDLSEIPERSRISICISESDLVSEHPSLNEQKRELLYKSYLCIEQLAHRAIQNPATAPDMIASPSSFQSIPRQLRLRSRISYAYTVAVESRSIAQRARLRSLRLIARSVSICAGVAIATVSPAITLDSRVGHGIG